MKEPAVAKPKTNTANAANKAANAAAKRATTKREVDAAFADEETETVVHVDKAQVTAEKKAAREEKAKADYERIQAEKAEKAEKKAREAAQKEQLKQERIKRQADDKLRKENLAKHKEEQKALKLKEREEKKAERERLKAERAANKIPRRQNEETLHARFPGKVVEGSLRFEVEGKWKGKQTVEINNRGADGEFDGTTQRIATSDLHQVHHSPATLKEIRKARAKLARAAKKANAPA